MPGYFRIDTRQNENRPLEFAWMWMIFHIKGFLRWYLRVYLAMEQGGKDLNLNDLIWLISIV